jgi:Holliday junction resolvase-like predicted endonuclease
LAWEFLRENGHELLAHNFHAKFAEIDLITRDRQGIIHIVEVKAYRGETHPLTAMTRERENLMKKAAGVWMATVGEREGISSVTFDLLWVKEEGIETFQNLF